MLVIPAIDIKDGKCVRLRQGKMDDETIYAEDPIEVAGRWIEAGARRLHLVDLNGATVGRPENADIIHDIVDAFPDIPIQVGGGIRDEDTIQTYLDAGVNYVIIGTKAKALDLVFHLIQARQNEDRRVYFCRPQLFQHIVAVHVGQVEIKEDNVIVIELAEIQALFSKVGAIDVKALSAQHQFDAAADGWIIFDQQNTHSRSLSFLSQSVTSNRLSDKHRYTESINAIGVKPQKQAVLRALPQSKRS